MIILVSGRLTMRGNYPHVRWVSGLQFQLICLVHAGDRGEWPSLRSMLWPKEKHPGCGWPRGRNVVSEGINLFGNSTLSPAPSRRALMLKKQLFGAAH